MREGKKTVYASGTFIKKEYKSIDSDRVGCVLPRFFFVRCRSTSRTTSFVHLKVRKGGKIGRQNGQQEISNGQGDLVE